MLKEIRKPRCGFTQEIDFRDIWSSQQLLHELQNSLIINNSVVLRKHCIFSSFNLPETLIRAVILASIFQEILTHLPIKIYRCYCKTSLIRRKKIPSFEKNRYLLSDYYHKNAGKHGENRWKGEYQHKIIRCM